MKRPARKAFVLLISIGMVLIAGCAGQQAPPNVKQSRTLAAENIELKKQLQQCNKEIETLKAQHSEETKKQARLLEACQQEKETWKNKAQQNIRDQVQGVLDPVMAEYEKIREENSELKAQIEKLQKESTQSQDVQK
jgi:gas vesicle protein